MEQDYWKHWWPSTEKRQKSSSPGNPSSGTELMKMSSTGDPPQGQDTWCGPSNPPPDRKTWHGVAQKRLQETSDMAWLSLMRTVGLGPSWPGRLLCSVLSPSFVSLWVLSCLSLFINQFCHHAWSCILDSITSSWHNLDRCPRHFNPLCCPFP